MQLSLHKLINEEQPQQNGLHTRGYTLTCMTCACKHTNKMLATSNTNIQVHLLGVDGVWLCTAANRWWSRHSYSCIHTHICIYINTHTCLRWWSELPCCADLYQSRDIKLSWQNGSCTSPTLQSADSHRVREHVCVRARGCLIKITYARK